MPSTALALLLPAIMAICAAAFLVISRYNQPAARAWGAGLGLCAAAFAIPLLPLQVSIMALVSDFLFVAGFCAYAEAFLIHFGQPLYRRERIAFVAVYQIMNFYVVLVLQSLHLELLLNDIAVSCLLGFALLRVVSRARTLAERALVIAGSVVVIDTLIRVLVFVYLADSSDRLQDFNASSYMQAMQFTTAIIGLLYVMAIGGALADRVIGELRIAAEQDPLTGLLNRRGFDRRMEALAATGQLSGAIVTCDIDLFKQVNDRHGHASGDSVLQVLALALRHSLPAVSIAARFGGEEFVCFVPGVAVAEAGMMAHGVRSEFATQNWHLLGIDRQITASFGVAVVEPGETGIRDALKRADRALYRAKAAGRNRVIWGDAAHHEPEAKIVTFPHNGAVEARRNGEGA